MIKENLLKVLEEIKNGNNLGEPITLIGATKMVNVDEINYAISNGLKVVAENRVQEFREKTNSIIGASQHFIGHLQTNKVKYLVGKVDLIHSVDSIRLGEEISQQCVKKCIVQNILVEINIGGELSKSGFSLDNAISSVNQLKNLPNIKVVGLMAMLPKTEDESLLKKLCLQMRELYDKLKSDGLPFEFLSVGMSSDYKVAIQNGSNTIRLGTTIFGKRNYEVKN